MAVVTEVPTVVEPPRPQGVAIELTWDEFLLLHAVVGETNLSTNRDKVASDAAYRRSAARPQSHLKLSDTRADLASLYSQLHKVYVGG